MLMPGIRFIELAARASKLSSLRQILSVRRVRKHYAKVVALAGESAPPVALQARSLPLISFVAWVKDASSVHLSELLQSFQDQLSGAAELIICDDNSSSSDTQHWLARHEPAPNLQIIRSMRDAGYASTINAGIAAARGEWICVIDQTGALTPYVVNLIAQAILEHPDCKLIYTDEVVTDDKLEALSYRIKPAYDEVLLSGFNYINHLCCYRRDLVQKLGGFREKGSGLENYDMVLRYTQGLCSDEIKHLPYPGWRGRDVCITPDGGAAGRILAERYVPAHRDAALGEIDAADGRYRIRFDKQIKQWPRVSIVIPNRDSFELISRILFDLKDQTDYENIEIIVIDNGTTDARVLALYETMKEGRIPFQYRVTPMPFNFSRQTNQGIAMASGELILLLNNDVEVIGRQWLREMVSCFDYLDTGIVGARLLFPDGRIQHAGVILGMSGLSNHWFWGEHQSVAGPMNRLHVRQSLTAVTGACMLVSRSCFEKVGLFDEDEFVVAHNDIDFCLRAVARGFRIIWTPFATLIHHESLSRRGSDDTRAGRARAQQEAKSMRRRYNPETMQDRAFSPWYDRHQIVPSITMLKQLPMAR
jgi:GT2 family glycosyltransferase